MLEETLDDFDASDVKKFKSVTVKVKYDGVTKTKEMVVFKYKGKWYTFDMWM